MKPESKFRQHHVVPFLKTLPNTYYDGIQQASKSGSLDFYLCVNGRFVGMELKKDELAVVSDLQKHHLQKIQRAGGDAFLVYPKNFDRIREYLEQLAKGAPR